MNKSPVGLGAKNNCAGEGQQQFSIQSKREPHFEARSYIEENKNLGHGSREDWSQV
jgi:hypothetical protein